MIYEKDGRRLSVTSELQMAALEADGYARVEDKAEKAEQPKARRTGKAKAEADAE